MKDCDEKRRAQLIGELYMPLPGQDVEPDDVQVGPWSDEEMSSSFLAFQKNISGKA